MYFNDDRPHPDSGLARRARILVIDDDSSTRLMAREVLEPSEFDVTVVPSGRDGLAQIETILPDIVLLDILMPEFDGFTTLQRIRELEHGKTCPVVMITGLHDSAAVERAYELGATDFITKPINWELLRHRLRYMLRSVCGDPGSEGESLPDSPADLRGCAVRILEAANRLTSSRLDDEQRADVDTIRDAAQQLFEPDPNIEDKPQDRDPSEHDAINRSRIDQLKGFTRADGSSLLRRVIDLFEQESRDLLVRLERAIDASLAEEVQHAAHKLKSVSGNVGADGLHARCNDLERLGRESRLDQAGEMLAVIRVEHARASEALERELENISAP